MRSRQLLHRWAIPPVLVIAGTACSAGDDSSTEEVTELIDTAGGYVVDNTDIVHTGATLTVGGLDITVAFLESFTFDDDNLTVPSSWPTLNVQEGSDQTLGTSSAVVAVAVFQQTGVVTDDDSREVLVLGAVTVERLQDATVVHSSTVTDPDTGITCWTEIRNGAPPDRTSQRDYAVVMFAGPGIASSGLIVRGPSSFTATSQLVGDIVESACGIRPEGL